ncbi:hypothetical protein DFO50_10636 [Microvirgula sp. AG722]|uniref:hypothetical protein n=1 Tax=Microvirgula sp. AG722 TaxID=2183901 RepID=UPI000DC22D4A|nr:hypothetical protein [Microvirgula sp. AG722]RAS15686.1 hypothetical protein DFO50_10636 [Microvirgula sp. AG722]
MTEKTNQEEEIRRYQQSFLDREKALQMVIHRMSASLNLLTCVLKETTTEMLPITKEKSHPYWVLVEACLSDMEETTETMERALTLILRKEQDQPFHHDRPSRPSMNS